MIEKLKGVSEKRLLGIDVGSKRMGLALWNPEAHLASPLPVRNRKTLKEDLKFLNHLIQQERVEAFVVGLPLSLGEKETQSTVNARFWMETLEKNFEIPVYSYDESLSTKEALGILKAQGFNARSKKAQTEKDSYAAALILEGFVRAQS